MFCHVVVIRNHNSIYPFHISPSLPPTLPPSPTPLMCRLKAGLKLREEADRAEVEKGIHLLEEPACEWACLLADDVMLPVPINSTPLLMHCCVIHNP